MDEMIYWTLNLSDEQPKNAKDLLAFHQRTYDASLLKYEMQVNLNENTHIEMDVDFVDKNEGYQYCDIMTQVVKLVMSGILEYEFYLIVQGTIIKDDGNAKQYRKRMKIFKLDLERKNPVEHNSSWLSPWIDREIPKVSIPMYKIYR